MRVELDGVVLAESSAPVAVFETGLPTRWYLERMAVDISRCASPTRRPPARTRAARPATGPCRPARRCYPDLAWTYDFPTAPLLPIAGLVAFYDEKVDVFLDGVEQERPVTHFSS